MNANVPPHLSPQEFEGLRTELESPDWSVRLQGVRSLRSRVGDSQSVRLLAGMMDDSNLAVIEAATAGLVAAGRSGMRVVLERLAVAEDDVDQYDGTKVQWTKDRC